MPAAELEAGVDQISRLRWRRICRRISSGLSMAMASCLASDWPRRSSGMAWIAAASSSTDVRQLLRHHCRLEPDAVAFLDMGGVREFVE